MRKVLSLVLFLFALTLVVAPVTANMSDGHEYAPIQEKKINYKDWTFKKIGTGEPVNLREWAKGKQLVLVVYLAPWCNNWKLEAPVVDRLYEKYKAHGFDVIGVSNYGTERDQQVYFKDKNLPYTVVVESDTREARDKTTHYSYRQLTGDARKWGSPYNIFLVPSKLKHDGEVLTEKAWITNGELVEEEADEFIRKRLGLKEEKKDKEKKADEKTAPQT
ncbi:MAG TPA: TlpA disulfide reductase family protein [Pyrinomonadaceae bacterium]|jgi:peroxiredoxin|nr:TlpA disulfide reductase family protein [Pyrinomonadaceae bacterium]